MANYYTQVTDNATQEVGIQTENNTPENYDTNAAMNGVQPVKNADGEIIGYTYNNVVQSDGYEGVTVYTTPSSVVVTKDPDSTAENIILNFETPGSATTEGSYVISPGASLQYTNRDDFIQAVLNNTGLDVDMSVLEANEKNYLYDAITPYAGVIPVAYGTLGEVDPYGNLLTRIRFNESTGEYKWESSASAISALIRAAKIRGYYDASDILEDDPVFKAQMRHASVGDFIGLNPIDDLNYNADNPKLLSVLFGKALIFSDRVRYVLTGNNYSYPTDFSEMKVDNVLITEDVNDNMNIKHNINCNMWAAWSWGTGSPAQLWVSGFHASNDNQCRIMYNKPEYGYAYIKISRSTGLLSEGSTQAYYSYQNAVNKSWSVDHYSGTGYADFDEFMIIYDSERFYDWISSDDFDQTELRPVIWCNGSMRAAQTPGIHKRNDAIVLPDNPTDADINAAIEVQYPDWYDFSYTETHYDPVTNNNVTNRYYTITLGTPGTGEPYIPDFDWPRPTGGSIPAEQSVPSDAADTSSSASKFYTVYELGDADLNNLGADLWDPTMLQLIKDVFQNPTDGVISLHKLYLDPSSESGKSTIYLGNIAMTTAEGHKVTQQIIHEDFGIVKVPKYFQDERDYTQTEVSIYIPFCGFQQLDPRDVVGNDVWVEVDCDVITGEFVAQVAIKKNGINGAANTSLMYLYEGNCSVQIPLTSADKTRLLTGIVKAVGAGVAGGVSGFAKGGAAGAALGAGAGVLGGAAMALPGSLGVDRGSGFTSQAGALTRYKTPFILINRKKPADAWTYNRFHGYQTNKYMRVGDCNGFTVFSDLFINIPKATEAERRKLDAMFKQGVIL